MRNRRFLALPVALAAALFAVFPLVTAAAGSGNARTYSASLWGANEVPGPGAANGMGKAWITLKEDQRKICWVLQSEGTDTPMAAHIHWGTKDVAGPVVVPLSPPVAGTSEGCAEGVDATLIRAMEKAPTSWYVNVHTAEFPGGAIRGQLDFTTGADPLG